VAVSRKNSEAICKNKTSFGGEILLIKSNQLGIYVSSTRPGDRRKNAFCKNVMDLYKFSVVTQTPREFVVSIVLYSAAPKMV